MNKEEQNLDSAETPKLDISDVSVRLDEGQLSFINKCKKEGLLGCSITVLGFVSVCPLHKVSI